MMNRFQRLLSNHFNLCLAPLHQGSVALLSFTVSLDIVVAVGDKTATDAAAREGGISMLFAIEWFVPETDVLLVGWHQVHPGALGSLSALETRA